MRTQKGQAAIEYLMNYAWAIALVTIVVVAIFALDLGNLQSAVSGGRSDLGGRFQTIGIEGHRLHGCTDTRNCTLDIAFKNHGSERVNLTHVEVTEIFDRGIVQMDNETSDCRGDMFPGDNLTCIGIRFDASNVGEVSIGAEYTLTVRLNYTVLDFDGNTITTQTPERELRGSKEAS